MPDSIASLAFQEFALKFRHFITLKTGFSAEECLRRLTESIDPESPTVFSLTGFKGSRDVIGRVNGYEFCLHKRRFYRNDFAPQFYGNFQTRDRGTNIEGYFDMPRWTKIFMRIWTGFAVAIGIPTFAICFADVFLGGRSVSGDPRIGLIVPPVLILFGILLPKFGLWLGRYEERFILEFLQSTLIAEVAASK